MCALLQDKAKLGVIVRKAIHLLFTLPLLLPFLAPVSDYMSISTYYSILMIVAGFIYVTYFKRYRLHVQFRERIDSIRLQLSRLTIGAHTQTARVISIPLEHIQSAIMRIEAKLREIIELAERDYERKYGYIGILMGGIGVACSYFMFRSYALYGILGLAVYDTVSAIVGAIAGKRRIPMTEHTVEGCLAAVAVFTVVLTLLRVDILHAVALSVTAMIAELFGIEDNLAIPLAVSAVAYFLRV